MKRSNGIFGKSGTGKTFLTRLLLIGMLQKSKATNLIFDMHNEYGWAGSFEGGKGGVKALKQLFPSKVAVFTLDEENSRHRGVSTDFVVRIGYDEIEPEDISSAPPNTESHRPGSGSGLSTKAAIWVKAGCKKLWTCLIPMKSKHYCKA